MRYLRKGGFKIVQAASGRAPIAMDRALAVTPTILRKYIATRMEEKAAPATINRELEGLQRAFSLRRKAGTAAAPRTGTRRATGGFIGRSCDPRQGSRALYGGDCDSGPTALVNHRHPRARATAHLFAAGARDGRRTPAARSGKRLIDMCFLGKVVVGRLLSGVTAKLMVSPTGPVKPRSVRLASLLTYL